MSVLVTLEPGHVIEVPLRQMINAANKMLLTDTQKVILFVEGWHKEVFSFLKACVLGLLSFGGSLKEVYVFISYLFAYRAGQKILKQRRNKEYLVLCRWNSTTMVHRPFAIRRTSS